MRTASRRLYPTTHALKGPGTRNTLPPPCGSVINLIRTQIEFDCLDNEKIKPHLSLQARTLCRCSIRDKHEHSTVSILRVYSHGALALTLALMPALASQRNALVSSVSFIASWSTTASNFKWILDQFV